MTERIVVVGLGDSITAGNPGYDPDPARQPFEGTDPESQYLYWAAQADPRIEFRNHGVGGERTDQILARFAAATVGADVLVNVLVVQGGINDVVHRKSIEAAARNLEGMVQRGRALGLAVALADVLPWNNGDRRAAADIESLNLLVAALAERTGVPLLRFHDTLVDPDRPTRMRDDWSDDGNHPSVEGHRRLGELAFRLPEV